MCLCTGLWGAFHPGCGVSDAYTVCPCLRSRSQHLGPALSCVCSSGSCCVCFSDSTRMLLRLYTSVAGSQGLPDHWGTCTSSQTSPSAPACLPARGARHGGGAQPHQGRGGGLVCTCHPHQGGGGGGPVCTCELRNTPCLTPSRASGTLSWASTPGA